MSTGRKAEPAFKFAAIMATMVAAGFCRSAALADDALPLASHESPPPHQIRLADFHDQTVPPTVKNLADWVADSQNNSGLPFVILDKPGAHIFVFDKSAHLLGASWVLVGLAPGDDSVPGIGTKPLTAITPDMRTTPAGRFVAALGHDLGKLDVVWVDYADAISMHRVINTDPTERRLERIVSPDAREHRISYGCINVPAKFFDSTVDPAFKASNGIVYILPEIKQMGQVFPGYYDVNQGS
jgi:hypothetical protein